MKLCKEILGAQRMNPFDFEDLLTLKGYQVLIIEQVYMLYEYFESIFKTLGHIQKLFLQQTSCEDLLNVVMSQMESPPTARLCFQQHWQN